VIGLGDWFETTGVSRESALFGFFSLTCNLFKNSKFLLSCQLIDACSFIINKILQIESHLRKLISTNEMADLYVQELMNVPSRTLKLPELKLLSKERDESAITTTVACNGSQLFTDKKSLQFSHVKSALCKTRWHA